MWFREKIGIIPPNPIIALYTKTPTSIRLLWCLRAGIVTLLCLIASGVSILHSGFREIPKNHAITVVLDISRSMLAEDLHPNRISVAKDAINQFLQSWQQGSISVIIFAGQPFISIADSRDTEGISRYIQSIHPSMILQEKPGLSGTNIGDALLLATETFHDDSAGCSVILVTDGNANIGINPKNAIEVLKNKGITLFSIGIGTKTTDPLFYTDINGQKNYFLDEEGNAIVNDLDEAFLTELSESTGGKYFSAESSAILADTLARIHSKIKAETTIEPYREKKDLTLFLVGLLIVVCTIEYSVRWYIRKKYLHIITF